MFTFVAGVWDDCPVERGVTGMRLRESRGGDEGREGGERLAKWMEFHTAVVDSGGD